MPLSTEARAESWCECELRRLNRLLNECRVKILGHILRKLHFAANALERSVFLFH